MDSRYFPLLPQNHRLSRNGSESDIEAGRARILNVIFPSLVSNLIDIYARSPSLLSSGLSLSLESIRVIFYFKIFSVKDSNTGDDMEVDEVIMDGIFESLCQIGNVKYSLITSSIFVVDDDSGVFAFDGVVDDPALRIIQSQPIEYGEVCYRCKHRYRQSGCNICADCFNGPLDFNIDPNLLDQIRKERIDIEIERMDEEIYQVASAYDETDGELEFYFHLVLEDCKFEVMKSR